LVPETQEFREKLDSRWIGPGLVKARGARSYLIELKPGVEIKAHRSFLKEFVEDKFNGEPIHLFYHQRTEIDRGGEVDEWEVDKILEHKTVNGKVKFLTTWKGHPKDDATWEEPKEFLPRYNTEFVAYCKKHGLQLDLVSQLG
jgi:hypothetical protein